MDNSTASTVIPFSTEVTQVQIVTTVVIGSLLLTLVVMNIVVFVIYRLALRSRKTRPMGKRVSSVLLLQVNPAASALVTRNSIVDYGQAFSEVYRKLDPDRKKSNSSHCESDPDFRKSSVSPGSYELKATKLGQELVLGNQNLNSSPGNMQIKCDSVGGMRSSDVVNQTNASIEVKAEIEMKSANSDSLVKRKCNSASFCEIQKRETTLTVDENYISRSLTEIQKTVNAPVRTDGYISGSVSGTERTEMITSTNDRAVSGNVRQMKMKVGATKDERSFKNISANLCRDSSSLTEDGQMHVSERKNKTIRKDMSSPEDGNTSKRDSKTQRNNSAPSIRERHISEDVRKSERKQDNTSESVGQSQIKDSKCSIKERHLSGSVSESDFDNDSTDDLQFIDDMHNMCDGAVEKGRKLQLPVVEFQNDSFEMKEPRTLTDMQDVKDIEL